MVSFKVEEQLDVYPPREALSQIAAELGFTKRERAELLIVLSELCSNIVKYGIRGSVELAPHVDSTYGVGISIVAHDIGPAFRDFSLAQLDGYDDRGPIDPGGLMTRGGLGIGLGAVRRLSDSLSVDYSERGKAIRVVRYLRRPPRESAFPPRW